MTEKILREFEEWVKTQPIYVAGGKSDREVLVIRNGEFESAIDVYLKEKFVDNGQIDCMDEDAKQASIPYTYNAPQHDWKCGYPNITGGYAK